jgi:hypothetical protein
MLLIILHFGLVYQTCCFNFPFSIPTLHLYAAKISRRNIYGKHFERVYPHHFIGWSMEPIFLAL